MMGLLGSLVGARGGRMLGGMIGGRTGAMVGGMLGSMVGSRQLGRLARSAMSGLGGRGDDGGGGGAVLSDNEAETLVRVMCNAAKADGTVDEDEVDRIAGQLGAEINPDEEAFLRDQLASPFQSAADLAVDVPAPMAAEAYAVSILAIDIDTAAESEYLADLASALQLSDDDRDAIHSELGVSV